jgi:hypothetical protein
MSERMSYAFERVDGWPPDGEEGTYIGFDADCRCSLLRWINGAWQGLRFAEYPHHVHAMPEAFVRTPGAPPDPNIEAIVLWHAPAPIEWPAREGAAQHSAAPEEEQAHG